MRLLKSLKNVPEVAQLICYDVVYSQEGVLLVVVMERGSISVSKYVEGRKCLTPSCLLYLWEGVLSCTAALHNRYLFDLVIFYLYNVERQEYHSHGYQATELHICQRCHEGD